MSAPPDPRPTGCWPIIRSSWATRCRLRREPDPRLQPERPARRPPREQLGHGQASAWKHDEDQEGSVPARGTAAAAALPRYTLTAFGDRIYARMGPTTRSRRHGRMAGRRRPELPRGGRPQHRGQAALEEACRRRSALPQAPGRRGEPQPRVRGDARGRRPERLRRDDRPPRADRDLRRLPRRRDRHHALGPLPRRGVLRGRQPDGHGHGHGRWPRSAPNDFGHRLLSLDGPTVYYQTNLGAVVALDAETGGIRWVATYPRQDRNGPARGTTAT